MAIGRGSRSITTDDGPDEAADLVRIFVNEVTWYMGEHKISRSDLASSMGVSAGRISQILSGEENLTLRTLSGVVHALGAEADVRLHPLDGNAELAGSRLR
jgi:transcriptional regulator with XRE-family HTH domain